METPFALRAAGGKTVTGRLQEILGVREFAGRRETYRSRVLPVSGGEPATPDSEGTPAVTVFDGAAGFFKWRDSWRQSNWLVILDRTDPQFADAAALVNQEYIQRRSDDAMIKGIPRPPCGVELLVYREARA
jgi:hypothetical protein